MDRQSTQPLRGVPGIFLGVKGGRLARKADNFTAICEPIMLKMWEPRSPTSLCYMDNFSVATDSVAK
jgi:hypothetical protein